MNSMNLRCIVCGKPVNRDEMCTSVIKSMKVTMCKDHSEDCQSCENRECEAV
jgi:hypothetical protein